MNRYKVTFVVEAEDDLSAHTWAEQMEEDTDHHPYVDGLSFVVETLKTDIVPKGPIVL